MSERFSHRLMKELGFVQDSFGGWTSFVADDLYFHETPTAEEFQRGVSLLVTRSYNKGLSAGREEIKKVFQDAYHIMMGT